MSEKRESAENKRERLRQEELKRPSSSVHGSGLADLVGALGWKGTGILIAVIIIVLILGAIFLI